MMQWGNARQAMNWLYNPWDLSFVADGRIESFQKDIANKRPTSSEIKKKKKIIWSTWSTNIINRNQIHYV